MYFVTWRLAAGLAALHDSDRDIVVEALRLCHRQRYRLLAYVVMDDHVHVVVRPEPAFKLSQIIQTWKSFTAHRINRERDRTGKFWQVESYDRIMRDDAELLEKMQYIIENPLKRFLDGAGYRWARWFPLD